MKGKKGFQKGKNNPSWKGNLVGYKAIHEWIRNNKPLSIDCENCHNRNCLLDIANISQEYKREFSDWKWLCRKCHMLEDGRINHRNINGRFYK